ncbi:MAG TPA: DUF1003 domain-containing protein [Bryobacteraceae bacterium]|nr:DUF1003 domain-containing protein [Bryobacteraceae bacterium]
MKNASATQRNIEAICNIEKETLRKRSFSETLGDTIAVQASRMWFILLHVVWFAIWIGLNLHFVSAVQPFDPFPFSLLTMIVSLEAIFLSLFVLMSQNRATRLADQRNHLDLQINLLAEHENTKILVMLQALCRHHQLKEASDPEIEELVRRTKPKQLLDDLRQKLPGDNSK